MFIWRRNFIIILSIFLSISKYITIINISKNYEFDTDYINWFYKFIYNLNYWTSKIQENAFKNRMASKVSNYRSFKQLHPKQLT